MTFSPSWCYQPGLKGSPARSAKGGHVENLYSRVVAQPVLKRTTFSPDSLVPVATTGTKDPYQPGLKALTNRD
jgi:hypothetical protein